MSAVRWCACRFRSPTAPPAKTARRWWAFNTPAGHVELAMITLAKNPPWPLDCAIEDLTAAGLPAPTVVRAKLFPLEARLIRDTLGCLSAPDAARVHHGSTRLLG